MAESILSNEERRILNYKESDLDEMGYNFTLPNELTVTITLAEYRDLIAEKERVTGENIQLTEQIGNTYEQLKKLQNIVKDVKNKMENEEQ